MTGDQWYVAALMTIAVLIAVAALTYERRLMRRWAAEDALRGHVDDALTLCHDDAMRDYHAAACKFAELTADDRAAVVGDGDWHLWAVEMKVGEER